MKFAFDSKFRIKNSKFPLMSFSKFFLIFILIMAWIFSGFPRIWQNPAIPPEIQKAQALDVANGDGLILYGISGNTTPQWRTYNGGTNSFGAETGTVSGATGLNFVVRTSPTKQEAIAGYVNSSGVLQVMCYDGTSWTNEWSVTVGGTGTTRRFDIAYETNSGDVMVLYSTNAATTNELAYRTKAGSTGCGTANWSAATNLDPIRTSGVVQWVEMAWDRRSTSNLITAIWADANADLSAMVWSGTAWGNEPSAALETSLELATTQPDDFEVEYESVSGDVMVIWANSVGANGTNGVRYATCTGGTSTCTWSAVQTPPTWADDATNMDLAANPNTDEMVFASIGNAGSDLQIGYWSGSAWTNTANLDPTAATPLAGTKLVACGWLTSGATKRSVCTYNDSAATNVGWIVGNGGTFTIQTDFTPTPAFGNPQKWYDIQTDPFNKDRLIFTLSDVNNDLFAKRLIMNATPTFTWTNADGGAALQANLPAAIAQPFSFAYWRFIPTPTFTQSAYRLFNNLDSTDVGTPLAAQDTAATLGSSGAAFRLRMLLHIGANQLALNGQSFKLQFAQRGTDNLCDTAFSGETYNDVATSTVIAYNDNPTPADGATLTANTNDPTHGADTIVNQTYEELNNFTNSVAAIPSGQDGKWDFSLKDNNAPASTTYCLRVVKADGTLLNTYSVIPEITTASAAIVSVSVSDGTVSYGIMPANTSKSTLPGELNDMQTATNDGNVTENFNIKGQNASGGGCTWTLASTNGSDQYVHQFCNDTDYDCSSPPTNYTALTTSYQSLDTGIPVNGTVQIQLRLTTPNPSSCFGQQSVDVTIQAVQP
ncbi:MAG: hypothetical protein ACPLW9_00520 [Minisyncoccales bacterium]